MEVLYRLSYGGTSVDLHDVVSNPSAARLSVTSAIRVLSPGEVR